MVRCQIDDDQGREAEGGVRIAVDDASLDWRRHWRCGTLADGTGVGLQLRRLALGPAPRWGFLLSVTDEAMAERFYQPGTQRLRKETRSLRNRVDSSFTQL